MKTVYLHVGNFKTGSSAIQKFCSDHRSDLLNCGFDYLATARPSGNPTNHGKIPVSLLSKYRAHIPYWYDNNDSFFEVAASVRNEIDCSPVSNIIISSEEFYRIAGNRKRLKRAAGADLHQLFAKNQVHVIMYVREPLEILKSWYNQANKSNQPQYRFMDFFLHLNNAMLTPQKNARFWRANFGDNCLIVEPYRLSGSEHIKRFLELVKADIPVSLQPGAALVNKKRNDETLELDRLSRIMLLDDQEQRDNYLKSFAFENPENTRLVQEKIDLINRKFTAFCRREGLDFPNASFCMADLVAHESKVNPDDVNDTTAFRRKLAKVRNSGLADFIKRVRRNFH